MTLSRILHVTEGLNKYNLSRVMASKLDWLFLVGDFDSYLALHTSGFGIQQLIKKAFVMTYLYELCVNSVLYMLLYHRKIKVKNCLPGFIRTFTNFHIICQWFFVLNSSFLILRLEWLCWRTMNIYIKKKCWRSK